MKIFIFFIQKNWKKFLATTWNLRLRYTKMLPVRKSWESARNIPGKSTVSLTAWSSVFCRTERRVQCTAQIATAYRSKTSQHASLHRAVLLWQKNPNSSFFRHAKDFPTSLVWISMDTDFNFLPLIFPTLFQCKICLYLKCFKYYT